jgi:excisionase family DNA binding protein
MLLTVSRITRLASLKNEEDRMGERYLSPAEVADLLGIPVATVYGWATRGTGPARIRVGRHTRYTESELRRWLASQTVASTSG